MPMLFALQLLELASLLNDRYKAKRVVVGCILPCFSARRSRRGFSPLEVRQYSPVLSSTFVSAVSVLVEAEGRNNAGSQHRADRAQPEDALHHSLETQYKVHVSGKQERALH